MSEIIIDEQVEPERPYSMLERLERVEAAVRMLRHEVNRDNERLFHEVNRDNKRLFALLEALAARVGLPLELEV